MLLFFFCFSCLLSCVVFTLLCFCCFVVACRPLMSVDVVGGGCAFVVGVDCFWFVVGCGWLLCVVACVCVCVCLCVVVDRGLLLGT